MGAALVVPQQVEAVRANHLSACRSLNVVGVEVPEAPVLAPVPVLVTVPMPVTVSALELLLPREMVW